MVSLRYHLTSLAAALLALALGVVVGVTSLAGEPGRAAPAPAPATVSADPRLDDLAQRVQARVLRNALPDQRVLVLLAPDAPAGAARAVATALRAAGSTVAGQLQLLPTLLDPAGSATVEGVVTSTVPSTLRLPGGSPLERAGALLAAALATSDQGVDVTGLPQQKVLGGFTGGSLVAPDGPLPTTRATLVLLVCGPARGSALARLAAAFQTRVGTVVAGTGAAARARGAVAVLRSGGTDVSDVDGLGTETGLLGVVLALAEQAAGGSGHYGTGPRADAVVPDAG